MSLFLKHESIKDKMYILEVIGLRIKMLLPMPYPTSQCSVPLLQIQLPVSVPRPSRPWLMQLGPCHAPERTCLSDS